MARIPSKPKRKAVKAVKVKKAGVKSPSAAKPYDLRDKANNAKPRNKATRKEIIERALKNKPAGSNARRVAYKEMGLKQDATTTGSRVSKPKKAGASVKAAKPKAGKVKQVVSKKQAKARVKASKLRKKGEAAVKAGKQGKALRMRKRYDRQTKKGK